MYPSLAKDLIVPSVIKSSMIHRSVSMSSNDVRRWIQHDTIHHTLVYLIEGYKRVILWPPHHSTNLYVTSSPIVSLPVSPIMDVEPSSNDQKRYCNRLLFFPPSHSSSYCYRYPLMVEANKDAIYADMIPGDLLFIPGLHTFHSFSATYVLFDSFCVLHVMS
jgi:hypothetical protein